MYLYWSWICIMFCVHLGNAEPLQTLVIRTVEFDVVDKTGRNETYHANLEELKNESDIILNGEMKSYCIVGAGLWISKLQLAAEPEAAIYVIDTHDTSNVMSCQSISLKNSNPTKYFQLTSIHHGGHSDLSLSAISLYSKPNFSVEEGSEIYFDGKFASFLEVIEFKSFIFTGKVGWTIYNQINYEGNAICVNPSQESLALRRNLTLRVGSIERGCKNSIQGVFPEDSGRRRDIFRIGYKIEEVEFEELQYIY